MLDNRRYDLDWLRVIAFGLLILYHVGMMYVTWGWHIKSSYISSDLEYLMLLVNPWRLPLLFFISGCAFYCALNRYSKKQLLQLRIKRLLIPILFGILIIVPPQLYYEMIYDGALKQDSINYWQFWLEYLDKDSPIFSGYETPLWGHMTWNHLWFVVYLLFFSLFFLLLKTLPLQKMSSKITGFLFPQHKWWILLLPALPLFIYGMTLRPYFPSTHAFYNDWYNNIFYFTLFLYGYWLAKSAHIWSVIDKYRVRYLTIAIMSYSLLMWIRSLPDDLVIANWIEISVGTLLRYISYINIWAWILALCGFAHHHLNVNSHALRYLNEAAYPYYILHQTIIIIIGYPLSQRLLGPATEPLVIITATIILTVLCHEVFRRVNILRLFMGLKVYHQSV